MKRQFLALGMLLAMAAGFVLPAAAEVPYKTYSYTHNGTAKPSPHAYIPAGRYDRETDERLQFKDAMDIVVDAEQNVYVADTGNNRVVVLSSELEYIREIGAFTGANGEEDHLSGPEGLFVWQDGSLYVADTQNKRLLQFDKSGALMREIPQPSSEILPDDFVYTPTSLVVDSAQRIYVVARGTNFGIISLNADGKFDSFLGAKTVAGSFWTLLWRSLMTDEMLDRTEQSVPTEFNNIAIDGKDFLFVTSTVSTYGAIYNDIATRSKASTYAPIQRLSPTGIDVLRRNGYFPPVGDLEIDANPGSEGGPSEITDVAIGENGVYSLLDVRRNKVFTYDQNGYMLYAFGGKGTQFGMLEAPSALVYKGNDILVLDRTSIVQYSRTEYGGIIAEAVSLNSQRKYTEASQMWEKILSYDNNYELSYVGIGTNLYNEGHYQEAMSYFEKASDAENYSKAFKEYRKGIMRSWFLLIPVAAAVVIFLFFRLLAYAKRENRLADTDLSKRDRKHQFLYITHMSTHPFDAGWDIKHEKRGSLLAANCILVVFVLYLCVSQLATGFIFNSDPPQSLQIVQKFLLVFLPVLVFCIANWSLTTLMNGKGTFRDIYIITAYALVPVIVCGFIAVLLSNILTLEESGFIQMLTIGSYIWSGILIFVGTMVAHDYTLGKNIEMTILTIIGIFVIVFLGMLVTNLVQRIVSFVFELFMEITYRT